MKVMSVNLLPTPRITVPSQRHRELREEEEGITSLSYPDLWVGDAKRYRSTTGSVIGEAICWGTGEAAEMWLTSDFLVCGRNCSLESEDQHMKGNKQTNKPKNTNKKSQQTNQPKTPRWKKTTQNQTPPNAEQIQISCMGRKLLLSKVNPLFSSPLFVNIKHVPSLIWVRDIPEIRTVDWLLHKLSWGWDLSKNSCLSSWAAQGMTDSSLEDLSLLNLS